MDFSEWEKIFHSPGLEAIQNTQKAFRNFDFNNYFPQINNLTASIYPSAIQAINNQRDILSGAFPFEKTLNAIETIGLSNQFYSQIPAFQNHLPEFQTLFRPFNAIVPIIESNSIVNRAFSNTGVFYAISKISYDVTATQAFTRINELIPSIENIDYDITFPDDNTVLVDDIKITKSDMNELSHEFVNVALDNSDISVKADKLKSKTGKCFLSILWLILFYLFFDPIAEDISSVAREHLGINKLLEKIDVKRWTNEIFNTLNKTVINTPEETNE